MSHSLTLIMYTYTFHGIVHPERAKFKIAGVPILKVKMPTINFEGTVTFTVRDAVLKLEFTTEADLREYDSENIFASLKNDLGEHARFLIDSFCYVNSFNYDVEIISVECTALDFKRTFNVKLEEDVEVDDINAAEFIVKILGLVAQDPNTIFLKNVFADFRRGIKYPHMSGFYFYRAVETIKTHAFNDDWFAMNTVLGFEKSHYDDLNKFRKPNAHGEYPSITEDERLKLAKDARKIIDAFLSRK